MLYILTTFPSYSEEIVPPFTVILAVLALLTMVFFAPVDLIVPLVNVNAPVLFIT